MKRIKILLVIIVIGGAVLSLQCISNSKEQIEINIGYQSITAQTWGALIMKKVDAMAAWEPYPSAMQYENKMTELVSGVETGNDYLAGIVVDSDWIESHKHIFEIFMECIEESHDYINKHPDESIEIICNESNFSSEVVTKVLGSIEWESTILSKDMKTLKEDCDFLVATKKIDKFPISKYIKN